METTTKNSNIAHNGHDESPSPLHDYGHKGKKVIGERISEIDKEWDIERTLLLNAAIVSVAGALLGTFVSKKWFLLTAVASVVMAEQAITGWSPASGLMKKLGKRTKEEIARERYGLKAMKGDFKSTDDIQKVWSATK